MKNKIFYLTRSYYPHQKGGGPLMRTGAVKYLKELGWNVIVVVPNYKDKEFVIENGIWQIPFKGKHIQKLASLLERIGLYEDYLDKWVENAFEYLKDKIQCNDIVFATSGGELAMIKLGSLLKDEISCKFVANFRDPLNYGYMNGLRRDKKFHIGREKAHEKYISNADLILTSSQYYTDVLSHEFTYLSNKIKNNYFGYISPLEIEKYKKVYSNKFKIAYVGTMSKTQSPELLYKAWKILGDSDIEIYFIGDREKYLPLLNIKEKGVHFIDFMPHNEFLEFMCKNIDAGFVSLVSDYFGACVPSKIYEYINLGLPIIAALPDGDGKDIINNMEYGIASHYKNINDIAISMKEMKDTSYLNSIKSKILDDKKKWSMQNKIKEVDKLLRDVNR